MLDPPLAEVRARLQSRNTKTENGTFRITDDELTRAAAFFQRPSAAELTLFEQAP